MRREKRKEYIEKHLKDGRKMMVERDKLYRRYSLYDKCPEWPSFWEEELEEPIFIGIRVSLELLPSLKEKDYAGLREAIEMASNYILFSGDELRHCNVKSHWLKYNDNETILSKYFNEHKYYIKGSLDLGQIGERSFGKLSDDAKKWFIRHESTEVKWGRVYKDIRYIPKIPKTFYREIHTPVYKYTKTYVNWERESRREWLSDKLSQDCWEEKIYHTYWPYSRDYYWFDYKMPDRKCHKRKLQRLKEEWAEEADDLLSFRVNMNYYGRYFS